MKNSYSDEEIIESAYIIATSNSLCETLTREQFEKISENDLESIAWEPFEYWSAKQLSEHIDCIVSSIKHQFGI